MAQQNYTALVIGERPPTSAELPEGPTWARLFSQRHADYDADLWEKLRLLHEGGFEIQRKASLFIDKAPQEPEQYYKWRLRTTAYVNHMARVIGHLIGGLFGVPLKVSAQGKGDKAGAGAAATPDDPFYEAFGNDCDLQGTSFTNFMQTRLTDALVQKRALIGVDMPVGAAPEAEVVNRLQEEKLGLGRAWLYAIPLEAMLDWEVDDLGKFKWCKLVKKITDRSDPLGDHSKYYYEFKIWRSNGARAAYEVYRTKSVATDEELKPEDVVPQVTALTYTSFSRIPIVNLELPPAVWAGNQLGPLCREHYNGRSDLRGSMCRNLVEIPYVKRGPEIPAMHAALPSTTQQDPNRGADPVGQARSKGFVALGSDDEIGFAGPSGRAFEMASAENFRVREEIYSALNTMSLALSNTGATVQRSGESKAEDRSATGVILDYLADQARAHAEMVYDCVSNGRGENGAQWAATGVDSYDDDDRSALIGEAVEVDTLPIPSKTFKRLYWKTLVARLVPKASAAEKDKMFKEIESNVTDEMVMPPKPLLGAPGAKVPGMPSAKPPPTSLPPRPPVPGKQG